MESLSCDWSVISHDCWSVISQYVVNSKTVFNMMLVSKDLYNVFNYDGLCFYENVIFSLWPFEKQKGGFIQWLSNGKEIHFVSNLSIGPLDILQRRLIFKKRKREEGDNNIFSGICSYDENIIRLIFKKFPRLKRMDFSTFSSHKLQIKSSIFLETNLESLSFTHHHLLADRLKLFSNLSKLKTLKFLHLKRWKLGRGKTFDFEKVEVPSPFENLESIELDVDLFMPSTLPSLLSDLKTIKLKNDYSYISYQLHLLREEKMGRVSFLKEILQNSCETLRSFTLQKMRSRTSDENTLDDYFRNCKSLVSLSIIKCNYFKGTLFQYFRKTLKKLVLENVYIETGDLFQQNVLVNLTDLSVGYCSLGNDFFSLYGHVRKLELLIMVYFEYGSPIDLEGFRTYKNLEFLKLTGSNVRGLNEDFLIHMFKKNTRLDHVLVNKCNPRICDHPNFDPSKKRQRCPDRRCHSVITREMMLDPKYENRRPRYCSPQGRTFRCDGLRWKIPNCHDAYWPFRNNCRKCCDATVSSFVETYTHSEFKTCGLCGHSFCLCCAKACVLELLGEKECGVLRCPKCEKKCRFCSFTACSTHCIMKHERVTHKERIGRKRSNSNPMERKPIKNYEKMERDNKLI